MGDLRFELGWVKEYLRHGAGRGNALEDPAYDMGDFMSDYINGMYIDGDIRNGRISVCP